MRPVLMFLFLVIFHIPPLTQQYTSKTAAQQNGTEATQNNSESAPADGQKHQEQSAQSNTLAPKNDEEWIGRFGLGINVLLAIPTFVLAIYAVKQANAALLNAQALINSERPWVMIQVKEVPIEGTEYYHGKLFGNNGFQLIIFNYGKTPAHILDCKELKFDVLEHPDEELPVPPRYGASNFIKRFLAPADSLPIGPPFHPHTVRREIVEVSAPKGEHTQGEIVVYGLIEYSDGVSRNAFRSAFCYRHDHAPASITGNLVPCGPRVYNEYS